MPTINPSEILRKNGGDMAKTVEDCRKIAQSMQRPITESLPAEKRTAHRESKPQREMERR
jgi:hypothetical protein